MTLTIKEKQKITIICEVLGIKSYELIKECLRAKDTNLYARYILAYSLHTYGRTPMEIASLLGKDRSTVYYYLNKYNDEYETSRYFRDLADEVALINSIPYMPNL